MPSSFITFEKNHTVVKAQGLDPGPGDWSQGPGAGARAQGVESGVGAKAQVL